MAIEVSRRAALRGLAGSVVGGRTAVAERAETSDPPAAVRAVTRNLYLGADLFRLFFEHEGSSAETVGSLLRTVDASAVERRMDAVATELAATRPDVVGLQEAAQIRTERPSDGTPGGTPDAATVRYDLLELLSEALEARGLTYDVAALSTNTDAEFPALVDGERVDVRLTDRDALLVRRETTAVASATTATFDAAFTVPVGDGFTLVRGYAAADVRVRGHTLTAASTHLEPTSADVRRAQAAELRAALSAPSTATVLGDVNDGPTGETGAYEVLTRAFEDAHAAVRPDAAADEPTCCFPPSLREGTPETALTDRYDVVLARGLRPTGARRVGVDPDARVEVDGDLLWPSDHAGVVASFETERRGTTTERTATDAEAGTGTSAVPSTSRGRSTTSTPTANRSTATGAVPSSTVSASATDGGSDAGNRTGTPRNSTGTTVTTGPGFGTMTALLAAFAAGVRLATRWTDGE